MLKLRTRRLRVAEDELTADGGALVLVWVVNTVDPLVRPGGGFARAARQRVLPHRVRRRAGVAVDEERADHLGPALALGGVARAAAVVAAAPVVQQARRRGGGLVVGVEGCVAVGRQLNLRRAAAEVLDRRV